MSAQLEIPLLPVADPAWVDSLIAAQQREARRREREELRRAVVSLCDGADNFGPVTTSQVLELVEGLDADDFEAPAAFRSMAARLRDLANRGMLERLPGDASRSRRAPAMWGSARTQAGR